MNLKATNDVILTTLDENDLNEIVLAFKKIGWHKPIEIYEKYLQEQSKGIRTVFIAKNNGEFCGYTTLKWKSDYPTFEKQGVPEIADLNVLPLFRKQGVATMLIEACEKLAKQKNKTNIGIGVGLIEDYGNAQRLYFKLGYIPDGRGLHYQNNIIKYGTLVVADDDLTIYLTKEL